MNGIIDLSAVEFNSTRNGISIQKKLLTCLVTGKISEDVVEVLPGINLSQEGMHILLKVINDEF